MKPFLPIILLTGISISCVKKETGTCSDGIKNQTEVYTDCGGSCGLCPISYPENGSLGPNLLFGNEDTLSVISSNYALKADVPTGSSLKIKATSISGQMWFYGTNEGWAVSTPTNTQTFEVIAAGTANLVFNLSNSMGSALLEFYENGDDVTKSKIIVWG
jgi:hypothetical protein